MSVTSGGTAPSPSAAAAGRPAAGSGGMVAVFSMRVLPSSRHQVQIEPSRLVVSTTTPRNPYSRGIVGRPDFERHLMIGAEIDRLHVAATAQIPKGPDGRSGCRAGLRDDAVFERGGSAHSLVTM